MKVKSEIHTIFTDVKIHFGEEVEWMTDRVKEKSAHMILWNVLGDDTHWLEERKKLKVTEVFICDGIVVIFMML